jgi:hypothetical protein
MRQQKNILNYEVLLVLPVLLALLANVWTLRVIATFSYSGTEMVAQDLKSVFVMQH